MDPLNNDGTLVILTVRLFNAKYRMQMGEEGQRARFHAVLNALAARRRALRPPPA